MTPVNVQGETKLETELTQLQKQLADLQAKRRLDLDLCHVRAVGLSAKIDRLESRFQLPALEKIRDRILLTHPPKERRKLKTVLDQFISQCAT
jgi:hypothetical protein